MDDDGELVARAAELAGGDLDGVAVAEREALDLPLVLADSQNVAGGLHVAPGVAGAVLGTIDAHERTQAHVHVVAERVHARHLPR